MSIQDAVATVWFIRCSKCQAKGPNCLDKNLVIPFALANEWQDNSGFEGTNLVSRWLCSGCKNYTNPPNCKLCGGKKYIIKLGGAREDCSCRGQALRDRADKIELDNSLLAASGRFLQDTK